MKKVFHFLKKTYVSWDGNDPWAKSAVIAYYALFSLPSLLMITMYVSGIFFGAEAVQGDITETLGSAMGKDSAQAIETMVENAAVEKSSIFTVVLGVVMLIFGATGVFYQLQRALNNIWSVRAKVNSFKDTLKRRATAFGLILVIAFLLLISLVVSSAIDVFSGYLSNANSPTSGVLVGGINFIVSQLFITALFASIFTILPDVKIHWKLTFLGAFVTSLLFLIGKYALGYYFTTSNPSSVYGAAGSVVLIILWVYYTCLILFFGAEFTVNWAIYRNKTIKPTDNAVLSYQKELEELRAYKAKIEADKKKAQKLAAD